MRQRYERTKPAVVDVETKANERIANRTRATVRLEQLGETWFLTVRPFRARRVYRMPLTTVADMVCWKVAKAEDETKQRKGLSRVNRRLNRYFAEIAGR